MVGTRRALLVAAPALALSACGKAAEEPQQENPNVDTGTQKQGDVDLLNQLLEVPSAGELQGSQPVLRAIRRDQETHVEALTSAIGALGGKRPVTAQAGMSKPFTVAEALRLETAAIATYLDVIPKLSDGRVRKLCAGILADRSGRLAELRLYADQPPVPEAFVS